jgi:hypothetical protein
MKLDGFDVQRLESELRRHLRERPYWTAAAAVGVGWVLGRSLPLRALIAVAGIGARVAAAATLEHVVREYVQDRSEGLEETR